MDLFVGILLVGLTFGDLLRRSLIRCWDTWEKQVSKFPFLLALNYLVLRGGRVTLATRRRQFLAHSFWRFRCAILRGSLLLSVCETGSSDVVCVLMAGLSDLSVLAIIGWSIRQTRLHRRNLSVALAEGVERALLLADFVH